MTPERKRLAVLLSVVVAAAAYALWPSSPASSPTPERASSPEGEEAANAAKKSRRDKSIDPSEIRDMTDQESRGDLNVSVHRNIFRFYVRPTPVPTKAPPPPTPVPVYNWPQLPTPTPQPTPIIPPAIPYTAIGIFGPKEKPIVTLEDSGRLINAREGDTIDGRFILRKINHESVDFAFVGLPKDITQRIPVSGGAH